MKQKTVTTVSTLFVVAGVQTTSVAEAAAETYPPDNVSGVFLTEKQPEQNSSD